MAKSCEDCVYFKQYINYRKMKKLQTDKVIWYFYCQNPHIRSELKSLDIANHCEHFDNDSWIK